MRLYRFLGVTKISSVPESDGQFQEREKSAYNNVCHIEVFIIKKSVQSSPHIIEEQTDFGRKEQIAKGSGGGGNVTSLNTCACTTPVLIIHHTVLGVPAVTNQQQQVQ
jgi:hypothetical protein